MRCERQGLSKKLMKGELALLNGNVQTRVAGYIRTLTLLPNNRPTADRHATCGT